MPIIPIQYRRPLRLHDSEKTWLSAQDNQAHAEILLRYALVLNTLEANWLKGCMAPGITYESQSVFDILKGPEQVLGYLDNKMRSIAASGSQGLMVAEISQLPGLNGPDLVVAIFQAKKKTDRGWRNAPVAAMEISTGEGGFIASMLMITAVPSPHLAKGLGVTPGYSGKEIKPAPLLRVAGDYRGLKLHLVQIDGLCPFDADAETAVRRAAAAFPGSAVQVEVHNVDHSWHKESGSWCGLGFPCLGIFWDDEFIGRIDSCHSSERIVEKIRQYVN